MTIVFDRGMNSTDNIEHVIDKMHVVGALPSSMCKVLFQIPLSDYEEEWESEKKNIVKAHMIQEQRYQDAFLYLVCVLSCVLLCLPFSVCITFEELATSV
jgi:transposase